MKAGLPDDIVRSRVEATTVPLVVAGGTTDEPDVLMKRISRAIQFGVAGAAVGRAVWGSVNPVTMARRVRQAVSETPTAALAPLLS